MNPAQIPFLVEGILIFVCMIFGILLGRAGKPYGKVKLVIHLFLFVWLTVGFAFILYGHFTISGTKATWIPVAIMGLMILTQFVTGIPRLVSNKAEKALRVIHMSSSILLVLSDIIAFLITGHSS